MENIDFQDLLNKYLTNTITSEEKQLLHTLMNEPEYQQQLDGIIDRELQEHAFETTPDKRLLGLVQQHLQQKIHTPKTSAGIVALYTRRIAAAIIILAVMGIAAWWLLSRKHTIAPPVAAVQQPSKTAITPGGNRATLQLANGQTIVLDSVGKGTLAQQGNTQVVKLNNGRLLYNNTQSGTAAVLYNTITTPRGGQYQLTLADGTKVWLNASSSLRFPAAFSGHERKVELTGEGYFEVAKNKQMPFHVQAGGQDVEVLGTHFNVNAYGDEAAVRTTLLEGSVEVKSDVGSRKSDLGHPTSVTLVPGEQAILGTHSPLTIDHSPNVAQVMAWKNGMFNFESADLKTILRQAARWYDVSFAFEGEVKEVFSGEISRNVNLGQLLDILKLTGKVNFEVQGRTVVVKP